MKKDIITVILGAVALVAAMLIPEDLIWVRFAVFLIAFVISAMKVLIAAFKGIIHGDIFNENTLMVVAAIGAFCISEYPEAVFVMLFYRVGELFEDYAVRKSRKSISEVMNICPDYANVLKDGVTEKVDPDEVSTGDEIIVYAGERVPLDGVVVSGDSFVDTSALTGESVPREIHKGDEILSGCINQNGTLTVSVTKEFEDSTVSRILELVETSAAKKSKSERFITKFAKYYTPTVLAAALLLAVVPPLIIEGAQFKDYIYRALSFLVVSCPCALVISVPLSFFGGIGGAAKQGILIKGGSCIEMLSKADTAVFDKTGTLTKGVFAVTKINSQGMEDSELIKIAALAESYSNHPIAQSIISFYGREINRDGVVSAEEIPGKGVSLVTAFASILVGNGALMELYGVEYKKAHGGTAVYIAVDKIFKGSIIISDEIKDDAKDLVSRLKGLGISKTYMLTGDMKAAAIATAEAIGIDEAKYELLPGDKVACLESIMDAAKGNTLYAGDGINDAPVLARSDIGIAMGALGSDAAVEAADVVIMNDDIGKIANAIKISRRTMSIAKENIVFSIAVKLLILLLCSLNIVGMSIAVFGDVGVMVLAVINSFRALRR